MWRAEWGAWKHGRVALIGVVLTAWAVPSAAEAGYESQREDSKAAVSTPHYVGGGLLGSLVGFGAGHAVQGRWSDTGIYFTTLEAAALAVGGAGYWLMSNEGGVGPHGSDSTVGLPLALVGGLAFAGLRFTEVVHVWILPQPSAYASTGYVDVRLSF